MKKIKILSPTLILIVITFFIVCSGLLISNIFLPSITAIHDTVDYSDSPFESESEKVVYVVKEHDGKIAVFEKGKSKPFKITSVNVSDLPKKDKEILFKGIEINNKKDLSVVLEDYCS